MRALRSSVALLVSAALLVACNAAQPGASSGPSAGAGSTAPLTSTGPAASAAPVGGTTDACQVVTDAEAATLAGASVTHHDGSGGDMASCRFYSPNPTVSVELNTRSTAQSRFDYSKRSYPGATALTGLGDAAFWAPPAARGPFGMVLIAMKNGAELSIFFQFGNVAPTAAEVQAKLEAMKALMQTALGRL